MSYSISERGLIDGESCPREGGQRTLSRTHGRERIWVGEGQWRLTKIRLKSIFPID